MVYFNTALYFNLLNHTLNFVNFKEENTKLFLLIITDTLPASNSVDTPK